MLCISTSFWVLSATKSWSKHFFCSFSDIFCWFEPWNHWKRFEMNKKGWRRLKKSVSTSFCVHAAPKSWSKYTTLVCLFSSFPTAKLIVDYYCFYCGPTFSYHLLCSIFYRVHMVTQLNNGIYHEVVEQVLRRFCWALCWSSSAPELVELMLLTKWLWDG